VASLFPSCCALIGYSHGWGMMVLATSAAAAAAGGRFSSMARLHTHPVKNTCPLAMACTADDAARGQSTQLATKNQRGDRGGVK
jgi:hypothetical protein